MIDLNDSNTTLNNIFVIFFNFLSKYSINDISIDNSSIIIIIKLLLLFCINNIYLINKLLDKIYKILKNIHDVEEYLYTKIDNISTSLKNKNNEILILYNEISKKEIKNNNYIQFLLYKKKNFNHKKISSNLDIYTLDNLDLLIDNQNIIDPLINYNKDNNFLGYQKINIGFNNFYNLHSYQYLKSNLPLNLLIYVQELDQVIIKIGNANNYKYINSKLYKVYNTFDTHNTNYFNENKFNSILCNNNIKKLNKKCYSENCKYYHDYILGYSDNYHKIRYFSSNPIVYNCPSFKDGSKIKENKKILWHNAINLYQSSLSNILLGCIHAEYINEN